jgi:DNA-binding PadR family transcriptional regulator
MIRSVRRRAGSLVPLEVDILEAAVVLQRHGLPKAHGLLLATVVAEGQEARRLAACGTLYKALDRLERAGCLESRWEEPDCAARAARPRRQLCRLTAVGEAALADALAARHAAGAVARPRPSEAPGGSR